MENKRPEEMERITTRALADAFIEEQIAAVKAQVGDKKVLLALSGGVDSSVVAALLIKAIGKNLINVHVNHGLLRKGEPEQVIEVFRNQMDATLVYVDATERFLTKLEGASSRNSRASKSRRERERSSAKSSSAYSKKKPENFRTLISLHRAPSIRISSSRVL